MSSLRTEARRCERVLRCSELTIRAKHSNMHKDITFSLLHVFGVADLRMLVEWHGAEALKRYPTKHLTCTYSVHVHSTAPAHQGETRCCNMLPISFHL